MIGLAVLILQLALIHYNVGQVPFGSTFQTLTYSIKPTWIDDPEPRRTIASNENRFGQRWDEDNAEDLGLTFAAKSEFPWIVDIRQPTSKKSQGYWSTGNLINQFNVFTTCRAIADLGDFKPPTGETAYVTFGQTYIFEYTKLEAYPTNWAYGGRRKVIEAKKHPKCNIRQIYYDGGLLTIQPAIKPSPPTINTIPLTLNYYDGQLPNFDLSTMDEQEPGRRHGRVCFVASIGRLYENLEDTMVKDFKVKYRVYWEEPAFCRERRDKLCPNRHLNSGDCEIGGSNPDAEGKELMCFQSRQQVGTVCDHDKGAALVCDGVVFGLVVIGAKPAYCSSVLPLPFWVQKVTVFKKYFEPVKRSKSTFNFGAHFESETRSSADSFLNSNSIQQLLLMLLAFAHCQGRS